MVQVRLKNPCVIALYFKLLNEDADTHIPSGFDDIYINNINNKAASNRLQMVCCIWPVSALACVCILFNRRSLWILEAKELYVNTETVALAAATAIFFG